MKRPIFTPEKIERLAPHEVFVFGTKYHGEPDDEDTKNVLNRIGAVYDQSNGRELQTYTICTSPSSLETVGRYVDEFIKHAQKNTDNLFYVTRIGCGNGDFTDEQIAPLFKAALELSNVCLPESFVRVVSNPQLAESYKLREYGQVRTLTDMVKVLNNRNGYTSLEDLMVDFGAAMHKYSERGTVSQDALGVLGIVLKKNAADLFVENRLNIELLDRLLIEKDNVYSELEAVYNERSKVKLLGIIKYLNDKKRYTSWQAVIDDLTKLFENEYNVLSDSYHYPFYFFKSGLQNLWDVMTINSVLDNDLLEDAMHNDHIFKVNTFGLERVLEMNYRDDGPCHPEVFFPNEVGTGPVYVEMTDGVYMKSCGEGKGPRRTPNYYEGLLLDIVEGKGE